MKNSELKRKRAKKIDLPRRGFESPKYFGKFPNILLASFGLIDGRMRAYG